MAEGKEKEVRKGIHSVLSCLVLLCFFFFAFISCDCRTYYKMYIQCNNLFIDYNTLVL